MKRTQISPDVLGLHILSGHLYRVESTTGSRSRYVLLNEYTESVYDRDGRELPYAPNGVNAAYVAAARREDSI